MEKNRCKITWPLSFYFIKNKENDKQKEINALLNKKKKKKLLIIFPNLMTKINRKMIILIIIIYLHKEIG